ncbi:MAG TPA: hypothetical protein DGG94_19985 [Micromonosporaceae bacterium]|nr:hypothetical protein [Micromonosporaceae bacterium]HCU52044.1 hypothetical protein [Micromonosporaceae bacterium]
MNRILRNPYGAVVFGLLCLLVAFMGSSPYVSCGTRPMQPGDTCTVTDDGKSYELSYERQKLNDQIFYYGVNAIGGIFIVVGFARIVLRRRRIAAAREAELHLIPLVTPSRNPQ